MLLYLSVLLVLLSAFQFSILSVFKLASNPHTHIRSNLMAFMENLELNVFDCVPVTFIIRPGQPTDGISELQQWASAMAMKALCTVTFVCVVVVDVVCLFVVERVC